MSPLLPRLRPGPLITVPNTISPAGPYIHQRLLGPPDNPYIHTALGVGTNPAPLITTPNTISQGGPLINTGQDMRQQLIQTLKPNFFPGDVHGESVPSEIPSSVPGIRIVRVRRGDPSLNWQGQSIPLQGPENRKGVATVGYNAVDAAGKIVGSINADLRSGFTWVNDAWIDPSLRNTRLFQDLGRPIIQRGKPVHGFIANERLGTLVKRLKERNPNLDKAQTLPEDLESPWAA